MHPYRSFATLRRTLYYPLGPGAAQGPIGRQRGVRAVAARKLQVAGDLSDVVLRQSCK